MIHERRRLKSFKREGPATYIGPDRKLHIAAADEPRHDHDPVTGEYLGLLIEREEATNLFPHSDRANIWSKVGVTVSDASDGSRVTETATLGGHYLDYHRSGTYVVGDKYTLSAEVAPDGRDIVTLRCYYAVSDGSGQGGYFDMVAKTYSSSGATPAAGWGIRELADGWWRIWITVTISNASETRLLSRIGMATSVFSGSYTGDGLSGIKVRRLQLEPGEEPSSFIPTEDEPVTRAADIAEFWDPLAPYDGPSLLPNGSRALERTLEAVQARAQNLPLPIRDSWNPDTCPADMLPWLAWALSVDEWNSAWPEEAKRAVIKASYDVHRHKGTLYSIRRVLESIGFGTATIEEGRGGKRYDGSITYDGFGMYGDETAWAWYRVKFDKLLSNAQADTARKLFAVNAPARCHLWGLDFTGAALLHNNVARYDGAYNYGVA